MIEFLFGLTLGVLIVITMGATGMITFEDNGDTHD